MNFVTLYLADENQVNETKNPITNHVKTERRTIGDKAHQELYKEKEEIKARKEKEKEESERAREKKQETKLRGEQKIKKNSKQKRKTAKDPLSAKQGMMEESNEKSRGKQNGGKQFPHKQPLRASGLKFRQNLKELVCDESSTDENNSDTCFEY